MKFPKPIFAGHYSDWDTEPEYYSKEAIDEWNKQLVAVLVKHGLSVIECDRALESSHNFDLALDDIESKAVEDASHDE